MWRNATGIASRRFHSNPATLSENGTRAADQKRQIFGTSSGTANNMAAAKTVIGTSANKEAINTAKVRWCITPDNQRCRRADRAQAAQKPCVVANRTRWNFVKITPAASVKAETRNDQNTVRRVLTVPSQR